MKLKALCKMMMLALCGAGALSAAEPPPMPKPVAQHGWLKKFAGEWESTSKVFMEPGKPPIEGKGAESAAMLGDFWVISKGTGEMMGMTMRFSMTLGYDPAKEKFIGTMIDSMTPTIWNYQGTLNEAGTILTLDTEGPCPMRAGELTAFQDIIEFKSDGHRVFTSRMKDEKGEWIMMFQGEAHKKP